MLALDRRAPCLVVHAMPKAVFTPGPQERENTRACPPSIPPSLPPPLPDFTKHGSMPTPIVQLQGAGGGGGTSPATK